jgi:NAD+ diphosphatase
MPSFSSRTTFAGNPLDRDHIRRIDRPWLQEAWKNPATKILAFSGGNAFLSGGGEKPDYRLAWLSPAQVGPTGESPIFLGMDSAVAHFAVAAGEEPDFPGEIGAFVDPRLALASLPAADAAIVAEARAMLLWHQRHRFCSNCGKPSDSADGGWKRTCGACEAEHFPRTDPVVIMVVTHGGKLLLGRQKTFPPNWYTALAGFMEPGETIEEAVAREVYEESAIHVGAVRYLGSQPWPFPSTLMIGCIAQALTAEIEVDGVELEDARWFTRDELRAALNNTPGVIGVPPPFAIAHHLIRYWVEQD